MITISSSVLATVSLLLVSGVIFLIGFLTGAVALYVVHRKQRALAVWVEENVFAGNAKYFAKLYSDYEKSLLEAQLGYRRSMDERQDPYFESRTTEEDDDYEDGELVIEGSDPVDDILANPDGEADFADNSENNEELKNKKSRLH